MPEMLLWQFKDEPRSVLAMADEEKHDVMIALLRALVEEVRSVAHDPKMVHAIADRLKHGIDTLADAIAEDPTRAKK